MVTFLWNYIDIEGPLVIEMLPVESYYRFAVLLIIFNSFAY